MQLRSFLGTPFVVCAGAILLAAGACASKVGGNTTSVASVGATTAGTGGATSATTGVGGATSATTGMGGSTSTGSMCKCSKIVNMGTPFGQEGMPNPTDTIYCPFSTMPPAKSLRCANQNDPMPQHCCEPPQGGGLSTCTAAATPCPVAESTDWGCDGSADCAMGQHCCSNHGAKFNVGMPMCGMPACNNYGSSFHGTSCSATCGADQLTICYGMSSDCPMGQVCKQMATKGNYIGVCQPM